MHLKDSTRDLLATIATGLAIIVVTFGIAGGFIAAAAHDAASIKRANATRTMHQSNVAACLRAADDYSAAMQLHCDRTAR